MWPGQYCPSWSSRGEKRVGTLGDCPPSSNPRVYPTTPHSWKYNNFQNHYNQAPEYSG